MLPYVCDIEHSLVVYQDGNAYPGIIARLAPSSQGRHSLVHTPTDPPSFRLS